MSFFYRLIEYPRQYQTSGVFLLPQVVRLSPPSLPVDEHHYLQLLLLKATARKLFFFFFWPFFFLFRFERTGNRCKVGIAIIYVRFMQFMMAQAVMQDQQQRMIAESFAQQQLKFMAAAAAAAGWMPPPTTTCGSTKDEPYLSKNDKRFA